MKDNLEEIFKQKLQNYEAPYDPKAWEAMSSKLGTTSGMSSTLKWILSMAGVGVIGLSVFLLMPQSEEKSIIAENNVELNVSNDNQIQKVEVVEDEVIIEREDNAESVDTNENNPVVKTENAHVSERIVRPSSSTSQTSDNVTDNSDRRVETNLSSNDVINTPNEPTIVESYIKGEISSNTLCHGDEIIISNQGEEGDVVKYVLISDTERIIGFLQAAGESATFKAIEDMTISFLDNIGNVIEENKIKVNELFADFVFEANIFEEGLPIVNFEAYGDFVSYKWDFNGEGMSNDVKTAYHFFEKGSFDVGLTVTDANGCSTTINKTVEIREKYNLMAVDAFKPNGNDSRNRTFMPYSLTERDVKFTLTIIDPMNSEVVYTTDNSNQPWDGVHQKTGKMTPADKSYVWKVQIYDPLPNERPIYSGTIIHD